MYVDELRYSNYFLNQVVNNYDLEDKKLIEEIRKAMALFAMDAVHSTAVVKECEKILEMD